ncbi:hypothetical protein BCT90_11335 [Vibrio lentus]|nr:hypothetical protein BCU56_01565 [Vibrio lentus]PMI09021.1 hypothetical protein BCU53_07575 [Vibrio lentus]PMK84001.1 hypothetical protein BCT90_11335 [Vibrio lentus]
MLAILAAILNFAIDVQFADSSKTTTWLSEPTTEALHQNLNSTSHVLNNLDDERRKQRYTQQSGRKYKQLSYAITLRHKHFVVVMVILFAFDVTEQANLFGHIAMSCEESTSVYLLIK